VVEASYFPARVAVACAAAALLVGLAVRDVVGDRRDTRRVKEYAFLFATTLAAVVYGVVHDQLTVTLSPEYFLDGKGLVAAPRPLRLAVAMLAVGSSWWVGLALGAALLIANNPRRTGCPAQLTYPELGRLAAAPLVAASLGAAAGSVNIADPFRLAASVRPLVSDDRVRAFLLVWGIHAGSYAGAFLGGISSVALVVVRRRRPKAYGFILR
jgi:hypothetical protein